MSDPLDINIAVDDNPDWIDARVTKAKEASKVTEATATALKDAMRGVMCQRILPNGDLGKLSKSLLVTLQAAAK